MRLRVKEIAQKKKMSMSKLSRTSDLAYHTIQAIYRNPLRDVTLSTLEKLADALEVDICDLFERVPEDEGKEKP